MLIAEDFISSSRNKDVSKQGVCVGGGYIHTCYIVASSPGQILSCSRGAKLGEGLGSLLRRRLEMVDLGIQTITY